LLEFIAEQGYLPYLPHNIRTELAQTGVLTNCGGAPGSAENAESRRLWA
jgi:hypothetical protein